MSTISSTTAVQPFSRELALRGSALMLADGEDKLGGLLYDRVGLGLPPELIYCAPVQGIDAFRVGKVERFGHVYHIIEYVSIGYLLSYRHVVRARGYSIPASLV